MHYLVDWSAKGGLGFSQEMLTWLGAFGQVSAVQAGAVTDPAAIGAIMKHMLLKLQLQNGFPNITVPWALGGIVNDQNVVAKSTAVYGEMYFDLSDDTKLTIGGRYQDDDY